mmetsp:Transcript_134485/g.237914  ORF Transcript_134485/g.237914 Transcript_134485/m.237914 type:complete len:200 (-) Transcript_134485:413-1012(-)
MQCTRLACSAWGAWKTVWLPSAMISQSCVVGALQVAGSVCRLSSEICAQLAKSLPEPKNWHRWLLIAATSWQAGAKSYSVRGLRQLQCLWSQGQNAALVAPPARLLPPPGLAVRSWLPESVLDRSAWIAWKTSCKDCFLWRCNCHEPGKSLRQQRPGPADHVRSSMWQSKWRPAAKWHVAAPSSSSTMSAVSLCAWMAS